MKFLILFTLSLITVTISHGEELLDVISTSPDKQYQVAIIHSSLEAKERDEKLVPRKNNFRGNPVVLIHAKTKQRVNIVGEGGVGGNVDIQWVKGADCFGYYERDEACWEHKLYRIIRKPTLRLELIKLPCIETLAVKLGDKPSKFYNSQYEFLSQELVDYGQRGTVKACLVTRWQVGRCGISPTLSYEVTFKTDDYQTFKPTHVERNRYLKGEDPIPRTILLNDKQAQQGGAHQPATQSRQVKD